MSANDAFAVAAERPPVPWARPLPSLLEETVHGPSGDVQGAWACHPGWVY